MGTRQFKLKKITDNGMTDYNKIVQENVYRLLKERKEQGENYTQAWLADQMNMSPQQLNNNLKGRRGLARIISRIAIALDVDLPELFADEGSASERQLTAIYREIIRLDPMREKYIYDYLVFQLQEAQKKSSLPITNENNNR